MVFLATSGDDDDDSVSADGGNPEETVRTFMDLEEDGNCESALAMVTTRGLEAGYGTSDREQALTQCRDHVANEQAQGIERERTVHDVETETDGDRATVTLTMTARLTDGVQEETQTFRQDIELVLEAETWMIENLGPTEPTSVP